MILLHKHPRSDCMRAVRRTKEPGIACDRYARAQEGKRFWDTASRTRGFRIGRIRSDAGGVGTNMRIEK